VGIPLILLGCGAVTTPGVLHIEGQTMDVEHVFYTKDSNYINLNSQILILKKDSPTSYINATSTLTQLMVRYTLVEYYYKL